MTLTFFTVIMIQSFSNQSFRNTMTKNRVIGNEMLQCNAFEFISAHVALWSNALSENLDFRVLYTIMRFKTGNLQ